MGLAEIVRHKQLGMDRAVLLFLSELQHIATQLVPKSKCVPLESTMINLNLIMLIVYDIYEKLSCDSIEISLCYTAFLA